MVVEVADTGWGIPEAEQAHVWDELWRGDRARRVEGSGLGLSLVRIVAERHGGDVAVRSRAGSGTSVRVRIPTA
ncbi:sensor histidine kinase [Leucobacter sp. HNU]|uniref:sensor histidine kinase n=1 Tax=Leucobacter sp. HNU TaxID=3236805 RepID=UPI003A7FD727